MLQILVVVLGVLALLKGELKVTRTRTLGAGAARAVGVALLAMAALPLIPVWSDTAVPIGIMFGGVLVVGVVAIILGRPLPTFEVGDRRHTLEPSKPQIVGASCGSCTLTIVTAPGAVSCEHCGVALHGSCEGDHLASAHRRAARNSPLPAKQ